MSQAMVAKGQYPTQLTAGAFLDALKLNGQADRCVAVFSEMMDADVDVGTVCFNIVVSALVQVRSRCDHESCLRARIPDIGPECNLHRYFAYGIMSFVVPAQFSDRQSGWHRYLRFWIFCCYVVCVLLILAQLFHFIPVFVC